MKSDELDEGADPGRHRRTLARLEFEDADRAAAWGRKFRRLFRRHPKKKPDAKSIPPPDDLPEIP